MLHDRQEAGSGLCHTVCQGLGARLPVARTPGPPFKEPISASIMRSSEVRKRIRGIVAERQNKVRQGRREDEWERQAAARARGR